MVAVDPLPLPHDEASATRGTNAAASSSSGANPAASARFCDDVFAIFCDDVFDTLIRRLRLRLS